MLLHISKILSLAYMIVKCLPEGHADGIKCGFGCPSPGADLMGMRPSLQEL